MRGGSLIWRAIFVGIVFGVVVQLLNTSVSGVWDVVDVMEYYAAWGVLPFFVGAVAATRKNAWIAGLVAEISAIFAFYGVRCTVGVEPWSQFLPACIGLIVPDAILVGPLFGMLGQLAGCGGPKRRLWQMTIPVIFAIEATLDLLWGALGDLPTVFSGTVLMLSCVSLLGLAGAYAKQR